MTARSPLGGLVRLEPSLYRRANDPLCAQRVRDGLVNGVLHKADSFAQVRVSWQPVNEALTVTGDPRRWATARHELVARTPAGGWYMLEPSPFGVIDVPVFGSGERYEFRLWTAWGVASGELLAPPPAADVVVRVFLYPWDGDPELEHERPVDHVWQSEFTSASVGYVGARVTGATRGAGAYANKLVLDPDSAWPTTELSVPNAPAGASAAPTRVLRVGVGVAASSNLGPAGPGEPALFPLLRALHVQGFVGVQGG